MYCPSVPPAERAYHLSPLFGDPAVWQGDRLADLLPLHVALRLVHVLADILVVGVALLAPHAAPLLGHAAAGVHQPAPRVVGRPHRRVLLRFGLRVRGGLRPSLGVGKGRGVGFGNRLG